MTTMALPTAGMERIYSYQYEELGEQLLAAAKWHKVHCFARNYFGVDRVAQLAVMTRVRHSAHDGESYPEIAGIEAWDADGKALLPDLTCAGWHYQIFRARERLNKAVASARTQFPSLVDYLTLLSERLEEFKRMTDWPRAARFEAPYLTQMAEHEGLSVAHTAVGVLFHAAEKELPAEACSYDLTAKGREVFEHVPELWRWKEERL